MIDRDELAAVIYGANYVGEWEPDSDDLYQQDAQASADAILAIDWPARVKREAAAEALEAAADLIRHKQHAESVRQMLTRRAAEYREQVK